MSKWITFKCQECGDLAPGIKARDGFKNLTNKYSSALGRWLYEHSDCVTQDSLFIRLLTEDDKEFQESPIYWKGRFIGGTSNGE